MKEGKKKVIMPIAALIVAMLALLLINKVHAQPSGAVLTPGASSRGTDPNATTTSAQAGNVTQLNIDQSRITDIWQGFFGNVSGEIILENAAGNNFYDWTLTQVTGEIYATRNMINDWSNINCTNSSHWEGEETTLNIPSSAVDGINETYSITSHPSFFTGSRQMADCRSTRPYNSTGNSGDFWNVLLNSNSTNTVYTSLLADNSNGFDNTTVDFELLVPTDRSNGLATYYFYAELS